MLCLCLTEKTACSKSLHWNEKTHFSCDFYSSDEKVLIPRISNRQGSMLMRQQHKKKWGQKTPKQFSLAISIPKSLLFPICDNLRRINDQLLKVAGRERERERDCRGYSTFNPLFLFL